MGELIMLARLLWSGVCRLAGWLAVPFCVLLAVATAVGFLTLAVCIDKEVRRDRQQAAKPQ